MLLRFPQDSLDVNCRRGVQMEMFSRQLGVRGDSGGSTWPRGRNLEDGGIKEVTEVGTVDRIEDVQIGELKHRAYFLRRFYLFLLTILGSKQNLAEGTEILRVPPTPADTEST